MKRKQGGSVLIEYIIVAMAIFIAWDIVDLVRDSLAEHQSEYTWSISQSNL